MPGRDPYNAFRAFVEPIEGAIACLATVKVQASSGGKTTMGQLHALHVTGTVDDGYAKIGGPRKLEFRARIFYEIISDDRSGYGPYRITTRGYDYAIRTGDKAAVLDFHWHPMGQSHETRPHIHLGSTQLRPDAVLSNKQHIGTGRVTVEGAIREAIALGGQPAFDDWAERLDACEGPHLQFRSWSIDHERETGRIR